MTRRYFVPDLPPAGGLTPLPDAEAQHATRVMRVQPGETITLFDGRGHEAEAVIVTAGRKECLCQAAPAIVVDREPPCAVHLGIALPKPDRARELIERLTELGVARVTPLVAQRTQRPPSGSVLDKLRRAVVEACKQSGRNQLLQLEPLQLSDEFFAGCGDGIRLIAHPAIDGVTVSQCGDASTVTAAIGPEGGWSEHEVQTALGAGFRPIELGPRIYRIETAATAIAAILTTK